MSKACLRFILNSPSSFSSVNHISLIKHDYRVYQYNSGAHMETHSTPSSRGRCSSGDDRSNSCSKKRVQYICKQEGCHTAAVSKGKCVRHGGGTRCNVDGCEKSAKLYGRCFHHGGFKCCSVDGCTSKAKRFGYCWAHGGGHPCKEEECTKMSTLGGFCWAHGGGSRCRIEGCDKRSYRKHDYLCKHHFRIEQTIQYNRIEEDMC